MPNFTKRQNGAFYFMEVDFTKDRRIPNKAIQEEIGRDYKSIVLYLCFNDDLITSEIPVTDERSMPSRNDTEGLPETKVKLTQVTCDKILWEITSSSIT